MMSDFKTRKNRFSAFTLVELVVVIAILAVLSGLAIVPLSNAMDRYQLGRAIETVEMFDARARRDAKRLRQPVQALVERNKNRLSMAVPGMRETEFSLPGRVDITDLRLRRQIAVGREIELSFSRDGRSATYALELQRGKLRRWLVVLGFSGQVVTLDNEGEVDALLSL